MNSENYQLMESFEQAWKAAGEQRSSSPAWQDFAPQALRDDLLNYILEMDIEQRAQRGLPGLVQQRYWEHPALVGKLDDQQKIALIKNELLQRRRAAAKQTPTPSHPDAESIYAAAFPALAKHPLWPTLPWSVESQEKDGSAALIGVGKAAKAAPYEAFASQLIGPYKLIQKLGEGGMGEVWMAEQKEPVNRRVAIKLVKSGLENRQLIARFEAERQALSMMDHPNIARVLDAGATPRGQPYVVMELVQGIPLSIYCDQYKLSIDERLRLFIPVCQAVQHAHQKGIIHRDLKPSNVLVCLYDGEPVAKVIDFGLAKALQPSMRLTDKTMFTEFGQVVGTLRYMSPEQAGLSQLDVDTRTDIYSLGVMLYELLTGSTPIDQETIQRQTILQVLEVIRTQEPPRPSARLSSGSQEAVSGISAQRQIDSGKLRRILRGELDWIVMRALEKDRTRRYETASGFAEDLRRYLTGEAVLARPPSAGYRLRKYARRNKGLVASLLSIATLLIGAIIGTSWLAFEANRARQDSFLNARKAKLSQQAAEQRTAEVIAERKNLIKQRQVAVEAQLGMQAALEKSEAAVARSNYFLANARWNEGRVVEARNLLARIPGRYRNFEWYYALHEFEGSAITLYGHPVTITCSALSPDGKRIISGDEDGELKLWDATSGEELKTLIGHTAVAKSVSFNVDGKLIVSSSGDQTIKLWDAASGKELKTLNGHTEGVNCVSFSPDGTRIVSGSDDHTLKIWSLASGNVQKTLTGHTERVVCVAFSPDSSKIVSGGQDQSLKLWHSASGEELKTLRGNFGTTSTVDFSPDGMQFVSGSADGYLRLWDANSGEELKTLSGYTNFMRKYIWSVAFSPDGTRIVSGCSDGTIRLWDTASGEKLKTLYGHHSAATCLCFSPDGTRIVSSGDQATLKIWDLALGEELKMLSNDTGPDWIAFSTDGTRMVSRSEDLNTLKLWDTASGKELKTLTGHTEHVDSVAFSPDGTRIASGISDGTIRLWDTASGKELKTLSGHTEHVFSVAFSPDGTRIASGSGDGTIRLWDTVSGEELKTLSGHTEVVGSVAFGPDGTQICSSHYGYGLILWDVASGKELKTFPDRDIFFGSLSHDGKLIVSGSSRGHVKLWDAASGIELKTLSGHDDVIHRVAFNSDSTRIISGGMDGNLRLWDVTSGEELKTFTGSSGEHGLAFIADGTRILSADFSHIMQLDASREKKILSDHTGLVSNVAISADGTRVVSQAMVQPHGMCEEIAWNAETGELLSRKMVTPHWTTFLDRTPDGKRLVIADGNDVAIIDLEYAKSPLEQARRRRSASIKPHWHREQAAAAESREDWYAATFHRAWAVKGLPDSVEDRAALQTNYTKLKENNTKLAEQLRQLFPVELQPQSP